MRVNRDGFGVVFPVCLTALVPMRKWNIAAWIIFSFDGGAAGRDCIGLIELILFWSFGVAILPLGHFYLLLGLVPPKFLYPFLALSFDFFDTLLLELLEVLGIC